MNGIPEEVVLFSRWKLSNEKFVFYLQISRLFNQFHTFRGLLSDQASLGSIEWNLWQTEHALLSMENAHPVWVTQSQATMDYRPLFGKGARIQWDSKEEQESNLTNLFQWNLLNT